MTDRAARANLIGTRRIVIKVGSRLLQQSPAGRPAAIADEVAALLAEGREVAVVSSGAIVFGLHAMGIKERPTDLPTLQAAAAVGQGRLIRNWEHAFSAHGIGIGQVLLTHDDIANRKRFLNARRALRALLRARIVPIINENDTVAVEEIKYGDNDMLAALLCNVLAAEALLIMTDVVGLLDADGERVPVVRDVDREASPLAGASQAGSGGSGGMASKVLAAKVAMRHGTSVVVLPGTRPGVLREALSGEDVGTLFDPAAVPMRSRKHWIAYGGRTGGEIWVDDGAYAAVAERGRSLLPSGIHSVHGDFDVGDIVGLRNLQKTEFARGLAGYRATDMRLIQGKQTADIQAILGYKYLDEVIHRDDLVLL